MRKLLAFVAILSLCSNLAPATAQDLGRPPAPQLAAAGDAFFQLPKPLPGGAPGTIIRSRDVTAKFLGLPLVAHAYQVMYLTADGHKQPTASIGTILVPVNPAAGTRVLLSYQTAEDGLTTICAPSHELIDGGTSYETPFFTQGLALGWDVLLSDYEGPKSQFTAGQNTGQEGLDGIRAAVHFATDGLTPASKVAMMGYSGGALATGWMSELQKSYAPELNIVGAALGGYPVNLAASAQKIDGGPFAGIEFLAAAGLIRAYPELGVQHYLNPAGKQLLRDIRDSCLAQFLSGAPDQFLAIYAFQKLSAYTTVANPFGLPAVQKLFEINRLGLGKPGSPVYIYQGDLDELISVPDVTATAEIYCATQPTVYVQYPLAEHISAYPLGFPNALAYLAGRVGGGSPPSTCGDARLQGHVGLSRHASTGL